MAIIKEIKFEEEFIKAINTTQNITVVYFSAEWSPECQQTNIILEENVKNPDYQNMTFIKLEAEDFPNQVQMYDIEIVPTFIFIKDQKVIDQIEGVNPLVLRQKLNQWAISFPSNSFNKMHIKQDLSFDAKDILNKKLKYLINKSANMLFMKGSPSQPQCGFSKQIIQILNKNDIKFDFFNILEDNEVREGLKVYSDWPTYPQLYSKGELIGGLDIVKELEQMNQLKSTLDADDYDKDSNDEKDPKLSSENSNLNLRLKKLVNQAKVMVFMKGHPSNPMCKFSKALVPILNETKVPYQSFDILEDEEVRQGLKEFSDWPTYPQIYVNGEFIGGLDIIKELHASGQLISTLNPVSD